MFPPHRKYLRFCVQGVHYQFRAMPFGITVAPRVFTKLMAAVGGHLRSQQIHIFMYLDDWLVKNQIRELLPHQLNQTIQLLVDLGLIINLDKCHLVPSQIITYLGAVFNLNKGLVLPSENRFLAINQAIADIIYNRQCPASHFLRLLGLMASCIDTVPYGRLHMRPIQIYLFYFWRPHIDGLHFKIPVFPILATHLMWWQQEEYFQRGTPAGISTQQSSVDRCIQVGLGCTLGHSSGGRSVDEGIDQSSYQLARDESCMECFDRVSVGDSGRESAYQMGQCHSSGIYKQARGNQINTTLSSFMGHDAVVFKTQHSHPCSSYSREKELSCRQVVPWSETCAFNRMGTQTINSSTYFSNNGNPKHRSLCHSCQLSASSVLQSLSRSPSMDMRCTVCELGGDICICISSPHTHSQILNESQTRELLNSSGSALSSTSVLVSSTSGVNSGCSSKTTSITRPVVSEQRSVITSKSKKSKSGSVENICRSKSSKQFSSKASKYMEQSIRSSTRRLYSVRWEIFSSWCAERQISPTSASVGNVADFFVYLHSVKKCKVATIIGYRSAISSKHKGWGGRSVSTNGDLSKLIKGIFNSNPILKPLLPNWDLPSVLWRLCDPPFEPLLSCDVKFLTWKTVFLIALATASRVSELHALSVKDGNLRYERHGIRLLPNLQFLSKTQRLNNPWIPIFIPSFHNFATEDRDLLLCPYRALKMYIKRTESQRKEIDSDSLFITYQKGVCRPGSKNSVARWIVSLIKWVYQDTSKHLSTVRAHDTRKLATSWALFNGASITEIIRAAHWASESTFTSFYMKDVPTKGARFARSAILETAKRKF